MIAYCKVLCALQKSFRIFQNHALAHKLLEPKFGTLKELIANYSLRVFVSHRNIDNKGEGGNRNYDDCKFLTQGKRRRTAMHANRRQFCNPGSQNWAQYEKHQNAA